MLCWILLQIKDVQKQCQCQMLYILTWWLHLSVLCDLLLSFWPLF